MSWFDEQIEERRYRDAEDFADAMDDVAVGLINAQGQTGHIQHNLPPGFGHQLVGI